MTNESVDTAWTNSASREDFIARLGGIFEHSPWVAERALANRPFASLRALFDAMTSAVQSASLDEKLALIRAHPELAGREAVEGTLTTSSTSEQARLGLLSLSRAEFERLADLNKRYRDKFGFPCIIALRLHPTRDSMLAEFERRVGAGRGAEIETALSQIGHIARGRIAALAGRSGGRLTTHVLDTANGRPAAGLRLTLYRLAGEAWVGMGSRLTNDNGRTDEPLLADLDVEPGSYSIEFEAGAYYRARGTPLSEPPFLDLVPIRFQIADAGQHYHVPLVCTPWSYSTYRGS